MVWGHRLCLLPSQHHKMLNQLSDVGLTDGKSKFSARKKHPFCFSARLQSKFQTKSKSVYQVKFIYNPSKQEIQDKKVLGNVKTWRFQNKRSFPYTTVLNIWMSASLFSWFYFFLNPRTWVISTPELNKSSSFWRMFQTAFYASSCSRGGLCLSGLLKENHRALWAGRSPWRSCSPAQGHVPSSLKHLQRWRFQGLLGQSLPAFDHPHGNTFIPNI